jgi:primosomal replication protein N
MHIRHRISLLGQALREPGLPVTHILLASRSESHICEAFHEEEVRPLVCEIPVKTSGKGVPAMTSLEGADVDISQ